MRMRHALLASVCLTFVLAANVDLSLAQGASALTGVVTSEQEGPMEGVLVTAKKAGSTIATTVVTNKEGRYSFPASRLEPGEYTIKIRAAGYDLDGKGAAQVAADKPATADLKLKKTRNLSAQLTTAEWLQSMPGTPKQKDGVLNCVSCHSQMAQWDGVKGDSEAIRNKVSSGQMPPRAKLKPEDIARFTAWIDCGLKQ